MWGVHTYRSRCTDAHDCGLCVCFCCSRPACQEDGASTCTQSELCTACQGCCDAWSRDQMITIERSLILPVQTVNGTDPTPLPLGTYNQFQTSYSGFSQTTAGSSTM